MPEVEEHKAKFVSFGGNLDDPYANKKALKKFLKYWDNGFRWTCCGMSAGEGVHGCDHHGSPENSHPCGCDFCRGGVPLPEKIYKQNCRKQSAKGLKLNRGPDPRSLSSAGKINLEMRRAVAGGSDEECTIQ